MTIRSTACAADGWLPAGVRTAALAVVLAGSAQAAIQPSDIQLGFLQPTGSVLATDTIPVWLRLSNTSTTDAFVVDPGIADTWGLGPGFLPTSSWDGNASVPFVSYTSTNVSTWMGCSGSFNNGCDLSAYVFDWRGSNPFAAGVSLAPGAHLDYFWGNFVPLDGQAPAGTYTLYRATIGAQSTGLDADGREVSGVEFFTSTCTGDSDAACVGQSVFTRTVSAVPEPGTLALMLAGVGLVVARRVRRPRR